MDAEIIAVGSELLTAGRIDTNSLYLTGQLNALGVEVVVKEVVGDHRGRLAEVIRQAMRRARIVILTGGLGPTEDDVTRDAVAEALDRRQIFHEEICLQIEERFRLMRRRMADVNKRQAFIIEGAEVLPNDRGTAPGQWIDEKDCSLLLLPGPPHELEAMFGRLCLPRLERIVPRQVIRVRTFRVAGMGESDLDQLIAPVYTKYQNPATTILSGPGDIQIHLRACCTSEAEALALLEEVGQPIEALLGENIYSRDGEPLEAAVGGLLRKLQATLAVAESCTGGMLAERITSVPGSSDYFRGGFITYTNRMKQQLLGVPEDILKEHGPVSAQAAEAMAAGARLRTGSTFALSVTGIAGPEGGTAETPVGTIYVGLAGPSGAEACRRRFLGDRARGRAFAAQMALDTLRRRCATVSK